MTLTTVSQLLDNIAHDERVTFIKSAIGTLIRRTRDMPDGTRVTAERMVSKLEAKATKIDLVAEYLWQTAVEVRGYPQAADAEARPATEEPPR